MTLYDCHTSKFSSLLVQAIQKDCNQHTSRSRSCPSWMPITCMTKIDSVSQVTAQVSLTADNVSSAFREFPLKSKAFCPSVSPAINDINVSKDPPKFLNQIGDPSIHDSQIFSDSMPSQSDSLPAVSQNVLGSGENITDNLSAANSDDHYGEPHSSSSPTNSTNSESKDPMALPPSSSGKIHANFTDLPAAPSQSTFSFGENISISSHQRALGSHDIEPHQKALGSHGFEMLSARFGYKYLNTYSYQVSKLPVNDRTTCDTSTTSHQMDNEFDDDYHNLPELHSSFDTLTQHPALLRPGSC